MKSNELTDNKSVVNFEDALNAEDNKELAKAFEARFKAVEDLVKGRFEELKDEHDARVLASRGIRELTNEEIKFYNDIGNNPTQGTTVIMPKTIFDQVFEDLRNDEEDNPLALIDLVNTTGLTEWLVSIADKPTVAWGAISGPITNELAFGFKTVQTLINKVTCFVPVSRDVQTLGPQWLDMFVREYMALGLKYALTEVCISGNGVNKPYGMAYDYDHDTKQGVLKTAVEIKAIDAENFGPVFKTLGKNRWVGSHRSTNGKTLFVDSDTYYDYIYAKDNYRQQNGGFVSTLAALGVKICICETGLTAGHGVIALPKRYFMEVCAKVGGQKGMVEFSDEYLFLDDKRVYKQKAFAHGFLKDNNGAVLLDFTALKPATDEVPAV